jgi:acetyl-CoA synthetase
VLTTMDDSQLIRNGQYNIGHICTRQQCDSGNGEKTALRWVSSSGERAEYTYRDLEKLSNRVANALLTLGIKPGDRIFTFLPRQPELYFSFLGILKVRAIAGVLFSNFGEEALADRLGDSAARILITKKSHLRKLHAIRGALPALEKVLVVDLAEDESGLVLSLPTLLSQVADEYATPLTLADTPSILHYTSGSTGKSKGAQHVHRSILTQAATFRDVLSVGANEMYWCTADPGWVTGVSYGIIGPFSRGVTQIQYNGNFTAEGWLRVLDSQKVNVWYTSPTALRMMMQEEESLFSRFGLSELRHIFCVGEPLNPAVIEWSRRVLRKEIYDTWWQTETGAIMIANRPGVPVRPGSMGLACQHSTVEILDGAGHALSEGQPGRLCIKPGWPSMFSMYHNRETQYASRFHDGLYDTGDMAYRDADGYFWFVGRSDDVINTAGHLVGPFEVESALLEMDEVADVGVIGAPDEVLFEKVVAYVKLKPGMAWSREREIRLRLQVANKVSSIATPQEFRIVESIPKNKSGKVMRRVLKAWFNGTDPGDLSTLEE